jgi:CheY-like chemotaxis protein
MSQALWLACKATPLPLSAADGARVLVVLVVEDEFFVRYDIATCLREAGYLVIECASGERAVALCRSGTAIDMVFTDINLSGTTSGFDVAECFRRERPNMPLLYMSGEKIDPARCQPGSVFLNKPLQHSDILRACQQLSGG